MKKKILGVLGLFLLPTLLWVGLADAQSFRSGDSVTVPADQVVSSTLFAAGQSIDIAGDVNGDIFCAGQNIVISGTVTGDVICAGQTINVTGRVQGDVRLAAQTITIGSQIEDSLTSASQTFVLQGRASVGRDASVAADGATLNGSVGRDLSLAATSATVSDQIGRNITAGLERLTITDNAQIGGNLEYTSNNRANIADGAEITGQTTRKQPKDPEPKGNYGQIFAFTFSTAIYALLSLLLVSLAVVLLFPQALHETSRWALDTPGKTLLIGFLASFLAPVAIIALLVTIIGIPLAILLILLWLVILFLSGPFAGYYAGRLVFKGDPKSPIVTMLVGTLIILVLYFIPIIGALTALAVVWMGSGMILSELMRRTPRPEYATPEHTRSKTKVKK